MGSIEQGSIDHPFKCDFDDCNKSFKRLRDFKNHRRVHTNERPYLCTICTASFKQSSALRTHTRTHTGDKPHGCSVCGKHFSDSSSCARHRRIHNRKPRYTCQRCCGGFTSKLKMQKHETRCQVGEAEILTIDDVQNKIEEIIIDTLADEDCYGKTGRPQALRDDHGRIPFFDPDSNAADDGAKLAIAIFEPPFDGFDLHDPPNYVPSELGGLAVGFSVMHTAEALRMISPVLTLTTQDRPYNLESLQTACNWTVPLNSPQWDLPLGMQLPSEFHYQGLYADNGTPWGCHTMQAPMYWSKVAE